MKKYPYHINGKTIQIKRVNWARFAELLRHIAPPEIHKELLKTLQGERWVKNPNHPISKEDKERYLREMERARINFYIIDGVDISFTGKLEKEIDRKVEEIRVMLGKPDFKPESRKIFYIEQILCDGPQQVAELIAAVTQLSHVDKGAAGDFARKFRTESKRRKYFQSTNLVGEFFNQRPNG